MAKTEVVRVKQILEAQDHIAAVQAIKTEYLGTQSLKISAAVRYESDAVAEKVVGVLADEIQRLAQNPHQQEQLVKLLKKSSCIAITHTTEVVKELEAAIREALPNVVDIQLEQSKANIREEYRGVIPVTKQFHD